jgi:hypothetical protein
MEYFNPEERARQKQAARDKDAHDIKMGIRTPEQVQKENSMFSGVKFKMYLPGEVYIGKLRGKLGVIKDNKMLYCIPDFLKVKSRADLIPLLNEYKETGFISIESIMKFESNCAKK